VASPFEIHSRIHGFRARDAQHSSANSNRSERVNMLGQETANISGRGAVASVRGSVVDVRFDKDLPPIHSILRAGSEGRIVIEVLAQLDARHVRGIALTPTQGLARGMAVEDTGGPLKAPVGKAVLSRMFDV